MHKIKVTIPYVPALSKNKRYLGRRSKYKNPEHASIQDVIEFEFRRRLSGSPIPEKKKVFVDIVWYRDSMRGDCSNFINPICDAVKRVLSFDDNWFAGSWNWFKDIKNPRIEITFRY